MAGRSSKIPSNALPSQALRNVFDPQFLPEELNVSDYLQEVETQTKPTQEIVSSIESKQLNGIRGLVSDVAIPLTEDEAAEIDRQINATLNRISVTQQQIHRIQSNIEEQLSNSNKSGEYAINMDISKKPRIRRAIKKLFGYKTDTITFSMYKQMLEAKHLIEEQESSDYLAGEE